MKFGSLFFRVFLSLFIISLTLFYTFNRSIKKEYAGLTLPFEIGRGIVGDGWTEDQFSIKDYRLISALITPEIVIDTVRPFTAGPANLEITYEGEKKPLQVSRDPIILSSSKSFLERLHLFSIEGTVTNPFLNLNSELRGIKFSEIRLHGIALPSPGFIVPIILNLLLLSTILFLLFKRVLKKNYITETTVLLLIAFIVSSFYFLIPAALWERSIPALIFLNLFSLGILLSFTKLKKASIEIALFKNKLFEYFAIATIFLTGTALRLYGISFGLPRLFHPDESRKIQIVLRILRTGDLDPKYFRHPTFLLYSTSLFAKIYQIFSGKFPTVQTVALCGRSVSVIFGSFSILFIFFITKKIFTKNAFISTYSALLASALFAVAPLPVVCSRYMKEDSAMIFFILFGVYLTILFLESHTKKLSYLFLAAFVFGVCASVKYAAFLNLFFLAFGVFYFLIVNIEQKMDSKELVKKLLLIGFVVAGLSIIGFLIITPYSIINNPQFVKDFIREKAHLQQGHHGVILPWDYFWTFHYVKSLPKDMGFFALATASVSIGYFLFRKNYFYLLIIGGIFLFYLPAEFSKTKPFPQFDRYVLPAIPFLIILLSGFITEIASSKKILGVLTLLVLLCPAVYSFSLAGELYSDTRIEASKWVKANLPPGSKILSSWNFYDPLLPSHLYQVTELKSPKGNKLEQNFSLEDIKQEKFDYLVLSSFLYNRYFYQLNRRDKGALSLYKIIFETKPLYEISKGRYEYGFHNPTIKIYAVKDLKIPD